MGPYDNGHSSGYPPSQQPVEDSPTVFGLGNERYVLEALLGEGSFGSVYRCSLDTRWLDCHGGDSRHAQNQKFAVKVVDLQKISMLTGSPHHIVYSKMVHEVEILQLLRDHPNVVTMLKTYHSPESPSLFIVMELVEHGDLFREVVRRRRPFREKEARRIVSQLSSAVLYGHERGIAHRDLKLENVLVASRDPLTVKLCDFGRAKFISHGETAWRVEGTARTLTTTPVYTPPEVARAVHQSAPYDAFKVDAFGLGVIMYVLLCNALPDAAKQRHYGQNRIFQKLSPEARDLVDKLLESDPERRLDVAGVERHPWSYSRTSERRASHGSAAELDITVPPQLVRHTSNNTPTESVETGGYGTPDCDKYISECTDAILAAQNLIKALQRERGMSCYTLRSVEGERDFKFVCIHTDEQLKECEERVTALTRDDHWSALGEFVGRIGSGIAPFRERCAAVIADRAGSSTENAVDEVFGGFNKILTQLIEQLSDLVRTLMRIYHGHSLASGQIRHHLLLLAAEQLGRERGFLCGHIGEMRLNTFQFQTRLAKIMGARKLLFGSSSPEADSFDVVAAASGLLPTLGLLDTPLLSDEDIRALEEAEANAFSSKDAMEWYRLLTKLVDQVHQHLGLATVNLFCRLRASRSPVDT
eukprot:TRINITY_DN5388_c0_g1_i1.p1 TRINITY_DN5388_c0_g1~~TRINITY_DN5388_c0_g1_i1.p1  ORF type:complete len:645 (+),score=95.62 TRINITY_DN5388_c0_g1_i1:57-1991(+)